MREQNSYGTDTTSPTMDKKSAIPTPIDVASSSSSTAQAQTGAICDVCQQPALFFFLSYPCLERYCSSCESTASRRKCSRCGTSAATHKQYFAERLFRRLLNSVNVDREKKEGAYRIGRASSVLPALNSRMAVAELTRCTDEEQRLIDSASLSKEATATTTTTTLSGGSAGPLSPSSRRTLCF
jgi:hypothetical protein